jgi:hypothetical protein
MIQPGTHVLTFVVECTVGRRMIQPECSIPFSAEANPACRDASGACYLIATARAKCKVIKWKRAWRELLSRVRCCDGHRLGRLNVARSSFFCT